MCRQLLILIVVRRDALLLFFDRLKLEKWVVKICRGGVCKVVSAFRLPSGIFAFGNLIVLWFVCFGVCYIAIILQLILIVK